MSDEAVTKEAYLEQLVLNAATAIAEGTTPNTKAIMIPCWKEVIWKEVKPILELID